MSSALMAAHAVVLKPAQLTPQSGSELGRIVSEKTDIPAGIFNVVVSSANEAGTALSAVRASCVRLLVAGGYWGRGVLWW